MGIKRTKNVFERIEQKNRLFFALMEMDKRKLTDSTRHRITRVLWPKAK